jgi:hypothetical protein
VVLVKACAVKGFKQIPETLACSGFEENTKFQARYFVLRIDLKPLPIADLSKRSAKKKL